MPRDQHVQRKILYSPEKSADPGYFLNTVKLRAQNRATWEEMCLIKNVLDMCDNYSLQTTLLM